MTPFNNEKYKSLQKEAIFNRIEQFDKVYIEVGGKIFDDKHASRVLPGFEIDVKMQIFREIKDKLEFILCISAKDIISDKLRGDNSLTYAEEVLRLANLIKNENIIVSGVFINFYQDNEKVQQFERDCQEQNLKIYKTYYIDNYPYNVSKILSENGFGKNNYLKTTKNIVIVSAPVANSGKLQTCLSQMYNDKKNGIISSYAKYETFPVWNLPLSSLVNIAYEMATVDIGDYNKIDTYYMKSHNGTLATNYNRDIESFPILSKILNSILGREVYDSPTSMGINMVGFAIEDKNAIETASFEEIKRRHQKHIELFNEGKITLKMLKRSEELLNLAQNIYHKNNKKS